MLYLNILNGVYAGKQFKLQQGINKIGRSDLCNIQINNDNISKVHVQLEVYHDKVILTDLNSTNGTFVNGLKVSSIRLHMGDKLALFEILLELTDKKQASRSQAMPVPLNHPSAPQRPLNQSAFSSNVHDHNHLDSEKFKKNNFMALAQSYIDDVVLPGAYHLLKKVEFKFLLTGFMVIFILMVTILSTLPLMNILKTSIEGESQRRALTIARTLAKINRQNLISGLNSAVSVEFVNKEPGVAKAYIISAMTGRIIAPNSTNSFPKESFFHEAKRYDKEVITQIDNSTIGAVVPIEFYNPNTGTQSVTAYSVVVYNMGSLAVDDGRVISLFIQTFFISLIMGGLLLFFLYKIITKPLIEMNRQLDQSLTKSNQIIINEFKMPILDRIVNNLNSLLGRVSNGDDEGEAHIYDRNQEMHNLLHLFQSPCLIIHASDQTIAGANSSFEELTGLNSMTLENSSLDAITDTALQQNIKELILRVSEQPSQLAEDNLEISGYPYQLICQAIYGQSDIAYIVISIMLPAEEEVA